MRREKTAEENPLNLKTESKQLESGVEMNPHAISNDQLIYGAFICFGLSGYALILGLWTEVAALYQILPEGADLSAYFVVSLQLANIAPFTYMACLKKGADKHVKTTIYVILVSGAIISVLLANFYDITTFFLGQKRSVMLLVFIFFAGMASTTTNVCYFPFVSRFRKKFTTALTVGQGLAGFLFGALGIIQGAGNSTPRFSIGIYFYWCFAVYVAAGVAFRYLEQVESRQKLDECEGLLLESERALQEPDTTVSLPRTLSESHTAKEYQKVGIPVPPQWVLLGIQFWLAAMGYGFIPSIITLLCANYQYSSLVILWATVLGMTADPFSRLLTLSPTVRGSARFIPLTLAATFCAVLLGLITFLNPSPPFANYPNGGVFPIVTYTAFMMAFAFTNTMVYFGLRRLVEEGAVEDVYRWSGFITQCGSFTGTAIAFTLIVTGYIA